MKSDDKPRPCTGRSSCRPLYNGPEPAAHIGYEEGNEHCESCSHGKSCKENLPKLGDKTDKQLPGYAAGLTKKAPPLMGALEQVPQWAYSINLNTISDGDEDPDRPACHPNNYGGRKAHLYSSQQVGCGVCEFKTECIKASTQPTMTTNSAGVKRWKLDGKLHREDGPAVEYAGGSKEWYLNGKLHREDGPAIEEADGYKAWYLNGKRHREDGPAIERAGGSKEWFLNGVKCAPFKEEKSVTQPTMTIDKDGTKEWRLDGKLHREDGPAVEETDGTKAWYLNDKLHREDGPAIELADGDKSWYIHDKLHREDGPAIEWADGSKEWYLNGVKCAPFEEKSVMKPKLQRTKMNVYDIIREAGGTRVKKGWVVPGDLDLSHKGLTKLPKLYRVKGSLNISFNPLESFSGCSQYVGGDFDCSHTEATEWDDCPSVVMGDLMVLEACGKPRKLLEGLIVDDGPRHVGGNLLIGQNKETFSLKVNDFLEDYSEGWELDVDELAKYLPTTEKPPRKNKSVKKTLPTQMLVGVTESLKQGLGLAEASKEAELLISALRKAFGNRYDELFSNPMLAKVEKPLVAQLLKLIVLGAKKHLPKKMRKAIVKRCDRVLVAESYEMFKEFGDKLMPLLTDLSKE